MDYVDFKTIHTISKNNNDKVNLCFISFFINRQSCACIDDSWVHQTLKDSLWYLMWLPFIPHFLNRLLTEASQSQIETCSKVFSIKPALKATELTKVFASCTWSSRASELIADNFFRVNYLKTSYHLFCSVLTVFLSIFIDNDFKVPKVNCDESIACKELISSEKMFASNI